MDCRLKDEAWTWDLVKWKKELRDGNMYEVESDVMCTFVDFSDFGQPPPSDTER
jgi:hypothetical protein